MDLHSYAKRRNIKKWSLEHKRKLVDARISCDRLFENHSETSLEPWKKFVNLAKLDDYNVPFVREQWFKMVDKYKQHKQKRLGNVPTKAIDENMLRHITEEWEFFEPMHHFMTHKTTDLHSYALKEPNQVKRTRRTRKLNVVSNALRCAAALCEQQKMQQQQQQHANGKILCDASASASSSSERINALCSSDTNEDFAAAVGIRNDHDFYSKNPTGHLMSKQETSELDSFIYADAGSEDTQESNINDHKIDYANGTQTHLHIDDDATTVELQLPLCVREEVAETMPNITATLEANVINSNSQQKHQHQQQQQNGKTLTTGDVASTTVNSANSVRNKLRAKPNKKYTNCNNCFKSNARRNTKGTNAAGGTKQQQQQQQHQHFLGATAVAAATQTRDDYYRHKRRYHHRQERRFDALLNVFGQIVRLEYPDLDVSALTATAGTMSASSDEEI